jgi:large subunit ribosomal protein L5
MTRLEKIYQESVAPELKKTFGYRTIMEVPSLEFISLNMGLGRGSQDNKLIQDAIEELAQIAGQKPVVTRAKKSIAAFKLREGMPVGCRVTLRRKRMWDFYDKLVNFALPRVRDFRGISDRGFDGRGNFTLGIKDHTIFPEINLDRVDQLKGMNITVVTSSRTDKEGRELLNLLGMPFRK